MKVGSGPTPDIGSTLTGSDVASFPVDYDMHHEKCSWTGKDAEVARDLRDGGEVWLGRQAHSGQLCGIFSEELGHGVVIHRKARAIEIPDNITNDSFVRTHYLV
jgi:hypothetical protein